MGTPEETEQANQNCSCNSKIQAQKKLVEELKIQWKTLWKERYEDKLRAEGVSTNEYFALSVEQGTIIHATKDFKALNFKEILQKHMIENPDRYVNPDVNVGGWKKFINSNITSNRRRKEYLSQYPIEKNKNAKQQPKKGGRGWLHSV